MLAAGRPEQGQRRLAGQLLQATGRLVQVGAIVLRLPAQVLPGVRSAAGPDVKAAVCRIPPPVGMVIGVAGKFMALLPTRAPPAGPVFAQGAIAFAGFFMGSKKGHTDLLALQHLGHQRRDTHVPRVERQVDRPFAGGCGHQRRQQHRKPSCPANGRLTSAPHGPRSRPRAGICPQAPAAPPCGWQCRSRSACVPSAKPAGWSCHRR